jgi:hypothetical protein
MIWLSIVIEIVPIDQPIAVVIESVKIVLIDPAIGIIIVATTVRLKNIITTTREYQISSACVDGGFCQVIHAVRHFLTFRENG